MAGTFPPTNENGEQVAISRVTNVTPTFTTEIVEFGNGTEQRSYTMVGQRKKWLCQFNMLNTVDLAAVEEFFTDHKGRYESFTFDNTDRDGSTYTCRFNADELNIEKVNVKYANVEVEIIEC